MQCTFCLLEQEYKLHGKCNSTRVCILGPILAFIREWDFTWSQIGDSTVKVNPSHTIPRFILGGWAWRRTMSKKKKVLWPECSVSARRDSNPRHGPDWLFILHISTSFLFPSFLGLVSLSLGCRSALEGFSAMVEFCDGNRKQGMGESNQDCTGQRSRLMLVALDLPNGG